MNHLFAHRADRPNEHALNVAPQFKSLEVSCSLVEGVACLLIGGIRPTLACIARISSNGRTGRESRMWIVIHPSVTCPCHEELRSQRHALLVNGFQWEDDWSCYSLLLHRTLQVNVTSRQLRQWRKYLAMVAAEEGACPGVEAAERKTPLAPEARLTPGQAAADHAAGSASTPGQAAPNPAVSAARSHTPSSNQLADTESGATPGRACHLPWQRTVQPEQPKEAAGKVPGRFSTAAIAAAAAESSDDCALFDTVGCVIVDSAGNSLVSIQPSIVIALVANCLP